MTTLLKKKKRERLFSSWESFLNHSATLSPLLPFLFYFIFPSIFSLHLFPPSSLHLFPPSFPSIFPPLNSIYRRLLRKQQKRRPIAPYNPP
ncbi:hypothetical protein M431DRAFT_407671 [Trichoderma harzianum CBS 226.95]|uniref:Uncharacterized protein n=1 Tax=Trichoderma harzianum CBS 226.95 TaxID=983964 RepID=A0A2T4AF91_TRIHA|nr:hypothetical protein M431DRAFT_407671 [Trichoderma harzianum CBS 226.95]PTB55726.1 hypothetical protein M431DRAFT_407671 [Trichoderma harzianum CBS 226.95]